MVLKKSPKTGKEPVRFEIETRSSNKNNAENKSVYGRNDDFRLFQLNPPSPAGEGGACGPAGRQRPSPCSCREAVSSRPSGSPAADRGRNRFHGSLARRLLTFRGLRNDLQPAETGKPGCGNAERGGGLRLPRRFDPCRGPGRAGQGSPAGGSVQPWPPGEMSFRDALSSRATFSAVNL